MAEESGFVKFLGLMKEGIDSILFMVFFGIRLSTIPATIIPIISGLYNIFTGRISLGFIHIGAGIASFFALYILGNFLQFWLKIPDVSPAKKQD